MNQKHSGWHERHMYTSGIDEVVKLYFPQERPFCPEDYEAFPVRVTGCIDGTADEALKAIDELAKEEQLLAISDVREAYVRDHDGCLRHYITGTAIRQTAVRLTDTLENEL